MRGLAAFAVTALLSSGCRPAPRVAPEVLREAIVDWERPRAADGFSRVEIALVPGRTDLVGALCDHLDHWDGFMGVYGLQNEVVQWKAECSDPPTEQSVLSMRALTLKGFPGPIFEVYGETHRGNGGLHLYELRGRRLVQLLSTRAVDFHDDGRMFENGCLRAEYRDVDLDGRDDVILGGAILDKGCELLNDEGASVEDRPPAVILCRRVFRWADDKDAFEELERYREGFTGDPESP